MVAAFAYAYFLSYGFRVVNAVAGPEILRDLGLGASAIGFLTSTYFLTFGIAQLPAGVLLDRWGPRRVEAGLLVLAAAGAFVFARAEGPGGLALGRGLIGLGVSVCFMASLKAFAVHAPARQAQLTALMLTVGTFGALVMSAPVEIVMRRIGWRGVFDALGALTLLAALVVAALVPGGAAGLERAPLGAQLRALRGIWLHPAFLRLVPIELFQHGGFMAVQGLWAGLYLTEAEALPRAQAATRLLALNGAALAAYLLLTALGPRVAAARSAPFAIFAGGLATSQVALGAALVPGLGAAAWPWALYAAAGAATAMSYPLMTRLFPKERVGRAVTALNLVVFAGGFVVQWGLGVVIDAAVARGLSRAAGHRIGFGILLGLGAASLAWAWTGRRAFAPPDGEPR
jgi:predicted MFS family arabinose efflux permease